MVEKNVQDSRRRIWIDAAKQRFGSLRRTQRLAGQRCRALWGELRHPEHPAVQRGRDARARAAAPDADARRRSTATSRTPARVSSTCLVTVERNRYSVPCDLPARWSACGCTRRAWSSWPTTGVVASHERMRRSRPDALRLAALHPAGAAQARRACATARRSPTCPQPLLQLQAALLRRPGGDRVMAQVLAAVPTARPGRGAGGRGAGARDRRACSAEHVLNVLAPAQRRSAAARARGDRAGD